jgi:hypothetical protein
MENDLPPPAPVAESRSESPEIMNWADKINGHLTKGVAELIAAGQSLIAAKKQLGHGNYLLLFSSNLLRIDERTAQMLTRIAKHSVLSNPNNYSDLPHTLNSLNVLSKVKPKRLQKAINDGGINPRITIKQAQAFIKSKQTTKTTAPPSANSIKSGSPADSNLIDESANLPVAYLAELRQFQCKTKTVLDEHPLGSGLLIRVLSELLELARDASDQLEP